MDLKYEVNRKALTKSGKPSITFKCKDCNHLFLGLEAYMYQANLSVDPRDNIEDACDEFISKLSVGEAGLFNKERTLKLLNQSVCNCEKGITSIENQRSINRSKQLSGIGERMNQNTPVVNLSKLLALKTESLRLHITLPELGWTFGGDNADDMVQAFAQIKENTPIFICQFTSIKSSEPLQSGEGFLPLKRFAALILSVEGDGEIIPLSKYEFEKFYCTGADTGKQLIKPKDLKFIDGEEMIKFISQEDCVSHILTTKD